MEVKTIRPNVPRSIPDRWLSYKPHGTVINDTNILAFKVPLKETITRSLPPHERFTPAKLMQTFPQLKFIIDLTNTTRYYQPKEFKDAGVQYIKIMIPGKMVPPLDGVKKFFKAMDTFMSIAKVGELIGVHCTHGINRTGYLICRYLVQQLGWEPPISVKAFQQARGYTIERVAYVADIMKLPRTKLDLMSLNMESENGLYETSKYQTRRTGPMRQGPMNQGKYDPRRRGFVNGRPFPGPHQPFGFGGPPHAFGPRPPIPPPPPPTPGRLYGPRPHAYGMPPMMPSVPPPGPAFPVSRFPPRMPGLPCMQGPPRLLPPSVGPKSRLPGPGMPPPRLPPPGMIPPRFPPSRMVPLPAMPSPRLSNFRRSIEHLRRECQGRGTMTQTPRGPVTTSTQGANPKSNKDMDFTLDTFDENLTSVRP